MVSAFRSDFLASIVVFLVALPLCMGIALASGLPPAAGLLSGVIGGLIVGYFSGCPLQVSGPAAGLVAVVWGITQTYGVESLGVFVMLAGLMQWGIGYLQYASWFRAVSPAVIQGGLAGLGILIASSQFHVMLDMLPKSSGLENMAAIPESVMKGLFPIDGATHHLAALIGVLTIVSVMFWSWLPLKGGLKRIPAPLIGIVVAVVFALVLKLPIRYIEIPENPFLILNFPNRSQIQLLASPDVWLAAFSIAFVGTIETVLTMIAIERKRTAENNIAVCDFDKELRAQGIGNLVCGVLGLLPVAGVIIRSAANIDAGGKTRLSAMLHGAWMLLPMAFLPFVLEHLPTAALAALLVYTGIRLVNLHSAKLILSYGRSEFAIYLLTVLITVCFNLLTGVMLGLGLSLMKLMHMLTHLEIHRLPDPETGQEHIRLEGSASFLRLPALVNAFSHIEPCQKIVLNTHALQYIDHACLDYLMNWEKEYIALGGEVCLEQEQGLLKRRMSLAQLA